MLTIELKLVLSLITEIKKIENSENYGFNGKERKAETNVFIMKLAHVLGQHCQSNPMRISIYCTPWTPKYYVVYTSYDCSIAGSERVFHP